MEQLMGKPTSTTIEVPQSTSELRENVLRKKIELLKKKQRFIEQKIIYLQSKLPSLSATTIETQHSTEVKPPEIKPVDIGELMRTRFIENNLTVEKLAEQSGVSIYAIENFLRANFSTKFVKKPETIFKITDILQIPREEITAHIAKLRRYR